MLAHGILGGFCIRQGKFSQKCPKGAAEMKRNLQRRRVNYGYKKV